jgi:hypothetical protein
MDYQIIEMGPFGSRILRGTVDTINDIPPGYKTIRVEKQDLLTTIYVEPYTVKVSCSGNS